MKRNPLDVYDEMPEDMHKYISNYGWHFTKRAYDYATNLMRDRNDSRVIPYTKDEVNDLLSRYGITIENKIMYDYVYVATMCRADYMGSSITDERQLALYIKDTVDDVDASCETTFRRWYATMIGNGMPIDWYELC